eukprot:gene8187-8271_t
MANHGFFCWNELVTPDVEQAKVFYATTFGWTYQANRMPEGGTYWVAYINELACAGIMDMADTPLPKGTLPFWFPYIVSRDIDATLKDVVAQKGKAMRPPWDVQNVGRLGIFQDASGSGFGVMTPLPRS